MALVREDFRPLTSTGRAVFSLARRQLRRPVVIATHSQVLLAAPAAQIYELDEEGINSPVPNPPPPCCSPNPGLPSAF